jgi:CTP synthase
VDWLEASALEIGTKTSDPETFTSNWKTLEDSHGILVPGGFGDRGVEGKILAVKYAREQQVPFLGICLGMQMAVVEFARNVLGWADAASTEMDPNSTHPVISMMEEQLKVKQLGGTMRLGSYVCEITKDTKAYKAYKKHRIEERHRHRYEFNNKYKESYNEKGMLTVGINPDNNLVEMVELQSHPFFVGCQFHPELKSTVEAPHPLFVAFVKESYKYRQNKKEINK